MLETLVSVREYLSTAYHPDVDYVDGVIEERNVGERDHGELQLRIALLLKPSRILFPYIETRLQVTPTRYRIPDECAYEKRSTESIFTETPALCVEILSPEDRMQRISKVAQDYLSLGVPIVWLLDPLEKKSYVADRVAGLCEVTGEISTPDGGVTFQLTDIFSEDYVY